MSFDFVFDASAWVEYFKGSKKGLIVKECLEKGSVATPTIVLAELSDKYCRENWNFWGKDFAFIGARSVLIELNALIAEKAGRLKNEVRRKYNNNFGLADAIIYVTALELKAKTVTADLHFRQLKEIVFLQGKL